MMSGQTKTRLRRSAIGLTTVAMLVGTAVSPAPTTAASGAGNRPLTYQLADA